MFSSPLQFILRRLRINSYLGHVLIDTKMTMDRSLLLVMDMDRKISRYLLKGKLWKWIIIKLCPLQINRESKFDYTTLDSWKFIVSHA